MARQKIRKRVSKQVKSRQKRRFLRYPLFIFLLLCAGAFLIAATFDVGADDVFVTASLHAPPVTQPPTITSPVNDTHFSSIPIIVSGTCPANAAYVEIFRNNFMSGTAICDANSKFQLSADLFPGQNDLVAHVFNITDDQGPVPTTTTVYYDVPTSSSQPVSSNSVPLALKTAFVYKGFDVGQPVSWPLEISGGTVPYALNVDWGDGNNDVISRGSAGAFNIDHTYSSPGGYKNSYTIQVKAADQYGHQAYLQFFVIVNQKQGQITGVNNITNKPTPSLGGKSWLWVAWPAYAGVFILAMSFWLGEREELIILRKRGLLRR